MDGDFSPPDPRLAPPPLLRQGDPYEPPRVQPRSWREEYAAKDAARRDEAERRDRVIMIPNDNYESPAARQARRDELNRPWRMGELLPWQSGRSSAK